ncbi:hypothetical protein PR048_001600 [Dryococelus australis]|uniref:Uncharacterized protein n=1 Tax=Dryococelus australis TaxID=614101 RepID=A0ABQ9IIV1_9NEOP|nr:hypothetical protein PR048_001600 [Dryococelus australis]
MRNSSRPGLYSLGLEEFLIVCGNILEATGELCGPQNRNRTTFLPACAVQQCTGQNCRVWANNVFSVNTSVNREFLKDCKQIYESEPCLRLVKCKEYHDRVKKDAGYARLLVILRWAQIPRKMLSAHRKEVKKKKKVNSSTKSRAICDEIYKPKLRYFPSLSFLGDHDTPRASRTNVDSSDDGDDKSPTEVCNILLRAHCFASYVGEWKRRRDAI